MAIELPADIEAHVAAILHTIRAPDPPPKPTRKQREDARRAVARLREQLATVLAQPAQGAALDALAEIEQMLGQTRTRRSRPGRPETPLARAGAWSDLNTLGTQYGRTRSDVLTMALDHIATWPRAEQIRICGSAEPGVQRSHVDDLMRDHGRTAYARFVNPWRRLVPSRRPRKTRS